MQFVIQSVAQDGYESNRITAIQKTVRSIAVKNHWNGRELSVQELRFSVDVHSSLTIQEYDNSMLKTEIIFDKCHIDSLIDYLCEVKTFISEEKMVEKLMGRR